MFKYIFRVIEEMLKHFLSSHSVSSGFGFFGFVVSSGFVF